MKSIYFYGDSNTYGYDPAGFIGGRYDKEDTWTTIVKRKLPQIELTADGMNGRCIPSSEWEIERIDSIRTDIFAVMLGTNDYLARPDAGYVADEMRRFLTVLHHQTILLCAPVDIRIPGEPLFDTADGRLSEALKMVADDLTCDFVDTRLWNCPLSFDGVHLSREGHRVFGERMVKYLEEKYA